MADDRPSSSGGNKRKEEHQISTPQPAGAVEMEDLSSANNPTPANPNSTVAAAAAGLDKTVSTSAPIPDVENGGTITENTAAAESSSSAKPADKPAAPLPDDSLSIEHADAPSVSGDGALACQINLLLTNGARHPFRIDEKYLTKRNVSVTGKTEDGKMDPFSITVYTLKELILRDWRKEWEQPPREPTSIRLIHFGKLLEDRMQLKEYSFSTENSNVVHMTVKPQEIVDEEEAAKQVKNSGRDSRRGGCCVIL